MPRRPVEPPYTITQEFGVADSNAYFGRHSGVDYAVASGTPVYAPTTADVWWAGFSNTGGNMVILFDGKSYHRLMHNSKLLVSQGNHVAEGQHIADAGSTGLSTGPHVHWDIATEMLSTLRPSSFEKFINPADWLKGGVEQVAIIQNNASWKSRFNKLHHQLVRNADMPDQVFGSIVGKDAWGVVESWSDHPEATQLINDQVIGQKAREDNWPGQIYGLQDKVRQLEAQLAQQGTNPQDAADAGKWRQFKELIR